MSKLTALKAVTSKTNKNLGNVLNSKSNLKPQLLIEIPVNYVFGLRDKVTHLKKNFCQTGVYVWKLANLLSYVY